jgi:hypothetical protein
MIDVCLPGQPDTGNEAGSEIDHTLIDSRQVGVWVEHENSIGEDKTKTIKGLLLGYERNPAEKDDEPVVCR